MHLHSVKQVRKACQSLTFLTVSKSLTKEFLVDICYNGGSQQLTPFSPTIVILWGTSWRLSYGSWPDIFPIATKVVSSIPARHDVNSSRGTPLTAPLVSSDASSQGISMIRYLLTVTRPMHQKLPLFKHFYQDWLVFNTNFSSISAILWLFIRNSKGFFNTFSKCYLFSTSVDTDLCLACFNICIVLVSTLCWYI